MKLTLNIGSGDRTFDEYPKGHKCINLDERLNLQRLDVGGDVKQLPFKNECFDYVLASDIIEHFPIKFTEKLVKEWSRVLAPGGTMEIRTPNMKWAAMYYLKTQDASFVSYHIFGGQDYSGNFHFVMFDRTWLSEILEKQEFVETNYKENGSNFIMKVKKL